MHIPIFSLPSWRQIGDRKENEKAALRILLRELGMLIFVIEWLQQPNNVLQFQ